MKRTKKCYDGHLVKNLSPVVFLMPYIMPKRTESEVKIDLSLNLDKVEPFVRKYKKEIPGLTLYHIVFATLIRAAAVTPEINRFIAGNRIYQRDAVRISMMVKKDFGVDAEESSIFPVYETTDTLKDIVEKTQLAAEEALKQEDTSAGFDKLVNILTIIPPFIIRGFIKFMMFLDRYGKLPKPLVNLQPFHSGFFVTNVGSIGLPVIYHHLYEFGTTSVFAAIGKKTTVLHRERGTDRIVEKRVLPVKLVLDSRICDGYTYSCALKTMQKCFNHPELLLHSYQAISQN